jgi:FkbM family methyltransferase
VAQSTLQSEQRRPAQVSALADSQMIVSLEGGSTITVPCISMNTLMSKYQINNIDLLKVDIEGADATLLEECGSWIETMGCMIIEIHRHALSAERVQELINHMGSRSSDRKVSRITVT